MKPRASAGGERGGGIRAFGLVALLLSTACTDELPMELVQASIREDVARHFGLEVDRVECPPAPRAVAAGDRFECTARTGGGATVPVVVTQIDAEGQLRFELGEIEGVLVRERLAAEIRAGLVAQTRVEAAVDCGAGLDDTAPGESLECFATDAEGRRAAVRVEVRNRAGAVSWSLGDWDPAVATEPVAAAPAD